MDRREKTLHTLVRWREFQQALARNRYQACVARLNRAVATAERAEGDVEVAQAHKARVFAEPVIDLARLDMVAAIEEQASAVHERANEARSLAEREREAARTQQHASRTRLDVAETGHDRVRRGSRHAQEIREFDQLAALLAAGTKR